MQAGDQRLQFGSWNGLQSEEARGPQTQGLGCVCVGGYVHVCVLEKGCGKGENWVDVGCAVQAKWALMSMVAHGDPCCRTVISNRSFFF